jgi:hypothetical protein
VEAVSHDIRTIQERVEKSGQRRVEFKGMLFVEINSKDERRMAGRAPYLDDRPLTDEERPPGSAGVPPAAAGANAYAVALANGVVSEAPLEAERLRLGAG